jgi:hypothetical protein
LAPRRYSAYQSTLPVELVGSTRSYLIAEGIETPTIRNVLVERIVASVLGERQPKKFI